MIKTTVMDADDGEAEAKVTIHRHLTDMHTLADDVGQRIISTLQQNPAGCVYFNPAVTVSCPSPTPEFFRIIENEQARWCRQASKTFSKQACRRVKDWVSHERISSKYARYLDRALSFTGILFIDGQLIPSHSWPQPPGITPTERRKTMNTANAHPPLESHS